jgi:PIN domain nuclease of toxin-antitoxin system
MSAVVADTHAVLWLLFSPHRLSAKADAALKAAVQAGEHIYLAAVTIVEVVCLVEKGRLPSNVLQQLLDELAQPKSVLVVVSLDQQVARTLLQISYAIVPDMPDRIIAATALYLGAPLVTRGARIQATTIPTIW